MNSVWTRRALISLLLAALILCGILLFKLYQQHFIGGGSTGTADVGGPFELVNQDGAKVTDADFHGRLMLIYFGFTFCPDACPTALGVMAAAIEKLDVAGERVVPILISIDPARDTPAALKEYVGNFHPRMVGLTGTDEQIAKVAKEYKVFYQKAPGATGEDYLMDHSTLIYLMDGEGKFLTYFGPQATPDEVAEAIRKYL
jgi:cytochrome oxidase Cu insertion factor (SCO1/SenC/PrrC family)